MSLKNDFYQDLASEIYESMANAFGGYSQVPDFSIGQAIVGQCNNGRLMYKGPREWKELLEAVIDVIYDKWQEHIEDPEEVRTSIMKGVRFARRKRR